MKNSTVKWTAYIVGGAMAVAFILPFVSFYGGTDEDGNDWEITRGINAVDDLAQENARRLFPVFIEALDATETDAEGYEVEVILPSRRGVPTAVWLDSIHISPNAMTGRLTVSPPSELRKNLSKGDRATFTRYQVRDWKYPEEGRWRGQFLVRARINTYPQEVRTEWLKVLHERPIP